MAYAHVSGTCGSNPVEVQVLSWAPEKNRFHKFKTLSSGLGFFESLIDYGVEVAVESVLEAVVSGVEVDVSKTSGVVEESPDTVVSGVDVPELPDPPDEPPTTARVIFCVLPSDTVSFSAGEANACQSKIIVLLEAETIAKVNPLASFCEI